MTTYDLGPDITPELDETAWVAPSAAVIGRVRMMAGSSLWFGATARGDNEWITLGQRTNVQDGSVLHTDMGFPLTLGDDVTVGHMAMLHGCTIGDNSLVGIGAVILNGAKVGKNCLIGARALITEGKEIPDGSLVMGAPAKVVRPVSDDQIKMFTASAQHYAENAKRYREKLRVMGEDLA